MSWYSQRVERDLARWQAAGWVGDAGAASIKSDLASRTSAFGVAGIFAILGAVLFGFAIMSFVAAHWTTMSKLARLVLILATLWGCYAAAAYLFARKLDAFAQAAVLAGIAAYGAGIMLIAQMYHMEGNPPDAVLYWAFGALLAAVLLQSRPALAATFVLLVVWSVWERMLSDGAHWGFLPVWVAAVAAAVWMAWRPGLHLAALSLGFWLVPLGFFVLGRHAHWLIALIALGFLARVLSGPRFSVLGQLATRVIAPRLGPAKLVPGPPKRFAQTIGLTLTTVAAVASLVFGATTLATVLLLVLVVFAALESIVGFCAGCWLFGHLMRLGLIPADTCAECTNIWARYGAPARP